MDTPEYRIFHDIGNGMNFFSRSDYQPNALNMLHLNVMAARNWFQIPNTYEQVASGQYQRQLVQSFNVAPGWVRTFSAHSTLALNPYFRRDHVNYYPSADPFADQPGTMRQDRTLTNLGMRADFNYLNGRHDAKIGAQITHTLLTEGFNLGLTDPTFNPVCLDTDGNPVTDPILTDPAMCAGSGFQANPGIAPGLVPYDLTRGGSLFQFHGHADIKQQAFYLQDSVSLTRNLRLSTGVRFDRYDGISYGTQWQPRLSAAYHLPTTNTIFRLAYSHSYETPQNENLVLSSATGAGAWHRMCSGRMTVFRSNPAFEISTMPGCNIHHVGAYACVLRAVARRIQL
jgi:outer membrane receptor protein involved in Fe transport